MEQKSELFLDKSWGMMLYLFSAPLIDMFVLQINYEL